MTRDLRLAIMQPYFFPYIGYFQLMHAVDKFVVYDNIKFTKKGWINRNRILVDGKDAFITLALKKDSDSLHVVDRCLAEVWPDERKKLLNRLLSSYRKAPYFDQVFPLLQDVLHNEEKNLFKFLLSTLLAIKNYIGVTTPIIVSSSILVDNTLRSSEKVLALCKMTAAKVYINPIGGMNLYSKNQFEQRGIKLQFLKANNIQYPQYSNEFVPFLSIIDVMMFNPQEHIRELLDQYTIL